MKRRLINIPSMVKNRSSAVTLCTAAILFSIFGLLVACSQSSESELEKNLKLLKSGNISGITLGETNLRTITDILGPPDVYSEKSDIRDLSEAIYYFEKNILYLTADSEYKINRIEYNAQINGAETLGKTDSALTEKVYSNYREAYKDILEQVVTEQQDKEHGEYCRGALIDLNGDGQEELLYTYDAGFYIMRYVIWMFEDGKPVKMADNEFCSIADGGRGGMFLVEYEGNTYPCRMYYIAEYGDFGIYHTYEFDLLGFYTTSSDVLLIGSDYSFRFGYYTRNNEINKEAFSFIENRRAITMAEFDLAMESLTNPTATLFDIFISDTGGAMLPELIEALK